MSDYSSRTFAKQNRFKVSSRDSSPFGIKVFFKYSENTLVSKNTKLSSTLRWLDAINIVVLKLNYSLKLQKFTSKPELI
jgi:hypothetical protein